MQAEKAEAAASSRASPSVFLRAASGLPAAPPPALPPASAGCALSGVSCLVRVDHERYLEHLLPLLSPQRHSAALPFRLPHGGVWWERSAGSGLLRLHLRFDLPAAPRRFDLWQIDISGLRVQQRWREDEDRQQRQQADWELSRSPAVPSPSAADEQQPGQQAAGAQQLSVLLPPQRRRSGHRHRPARSGCELRRLVTERAAAACV